MHYNAADTAYENRAQNHSSEMSPPLRPVWRSPSTEYPPYQNQRGRGDSRGLLPPGYYESPRLTPFHGGSGLGRRRYPGGRGPESDRDSPRVELECPDLWRAFHERTTEMVITKSGR